MKRAREEASELGDQDAGHSLPAPALASQPDASAATAKRRPRVSSDGQQPGMPALDLTGQSSDSSADQLQRASPQE